jgi:hypothetical protein
MFSPIHSGFRHNYSVEKSTNSDSYRAFALKTLYIVVASHWDETSPWNEQNDQAMQERSSDRLRVLVENSSQLNK